MEGQYKMFRTKNGKTAFAVVGVIARSSGEDIFWKASVAGFRSSIEAGVRLALREHLQYGGTSQSIEICKFVQNPADTMEDAVECAATLATWKALGHAEGEAKIVFQENRWNVSFSPLKKPA